MALFKKDFMNKILIMGIGFLGKALVSEFQNKGFEIGVLSRRLLNLNSSSNQVSEHCVDILNYDALDNVISQYDFIINCTGQISLPIKSSLVQNTEGISNIVNAVKKYNKKLIHLSSVSVYGSSEYVNEESDCNPQSAYACTKYFAEYIINQKLDSSVILRISNIYGEGQFQGIMSYLSQQYLEDNSDLQFNNNGEMKRYYLDINDLTKIIFSVIARNLKPGSYNVIGPDFITIKALIARFNSILNYHFIAKYSSFPPIEDIDKIDNLKIREELKIEFNNSIDFFIKNLRDDKK